MKTQQNGVLIIMQLLSEYFGTKKWNSQSVVTRNETIFLWNTNIFFLIKLNFSDKIRKAF